MASFQFGLISKSLWHSVRFRSLGDPVAKLVYCYLHTNEHRNSVGCYRLRRAYAAADIDVSIEVFDRAIDRAIDSGLIAYDRDTEIVLILDFFRFNPITNPKHSKGAIKCLLSLPESPIKAKAIEVYNAHVQEKGYETIELKGFDTPMDSPSDTPIKRAINTPPIQREHGNTGTLSSVSPKETNSEKPTSTRQSPGGPSKYAFDGQIIKLDQEDLDAWTKAFSVLPNLIAELQSRDDWLRSQPEGDRKRWFNSTSSYLRNKCAEIASAAKRGRSLTESAADWEGESDSEEF